jgi:hypothetical protein
MSYRPLHLTSVIELYRRRGLTANEFWENRVEIVETVTAVRTLHRLDAARDRPRSACARMARSSLLREPHEHFALPADDGRLLSSLFDFAKGKDLADIRIEDSLPDERGDLTEYQESRGY